MAANALMTAAPYIIQAASAVGQHLMNSQSSAQSASASYGVNEALMRQNFLYNWISSNLAEQQYYRTGRYNQDLANEAMANAYNYNLDLMNRSNAFQEQMSNTAHQREMADLKAAGLNPILAANSGAYSSFGSSASVNALSGSGSGFMGNTSGSGIGITSPVTDLNAFARTGLEGKRVKNETDLNKWQQKELETKADYNTAQEYQAYENVQLQKDELEFQKQQFKEEIQLRKYQAKTERMSATAAQSQANSSAQNANTGSARLAQDKLEYGQSTQARMNQFYQDHPIIRDVHSFFNGFGGFNFSPRAYTFNR